MFEVVRNPSDAEFWIKELEARNSVERIMMAFGGLSCIEERNLFLALANLK
jgi:hypothetical protein